MTGGELAEAKRYGRLDLACSLADKFIDVAFLAVAAFVLARPLDAWLQTVPLTAGNWSLRLVALLLIVMALHVAVSFPLSFYSGHRLEHRFKLSTQTFGRWLWRYAKRNLLAVAFSSVMFLALYWLIWTTGRFWWMAAAAVFFVVTIVLGRLAPVLILPLFYHIEKLDVPELADRIARRAQGTGLSIEGVYRMDMSDETVKANAMLAGLGSTRRVLLGDTLLAGFSPDEIEVVFAHEIGHHVFRHIRKIMLAGLLCSTLGFWICDRLLVVWADGPGTGPFFGEKTQFPEKPLTENMDLSPSRQTPSRQTVDYAHMPVATLPLVMFILTLFALMLEPLQNAMSRRFERQADRYALDSTGLNDAYLSAFRKLARLNKDDPNPHWLDVLLFHSHPPVAERLAMAEKREEKKGNPSEA